MEVDDIDDNAQSISTATNLTSLAHQECATVINNLADLFQQFGTRDQPDIARSTIETLAQVTRLCTAGTLHIWCYNQLMLGRCCIDLDIELTMSLTPFAARQHAACALECSDHPVTHIDCRQCHRSLLQGADGSLAHTARQCQGAVCCCAETDDCQYPRLGRQHWGCGHKGCANCRSPQTHCGSQVAGSTVCARCGEVCYQPLQTCSACSSTAM